MLNECEAIRITAGLDDISSVAEVIVREADGYGIWAFEGTFGSGKTSLIKEICTHLGVTDNVNSPSFSIVNEYALPNGDPVYHFDFYRMMCEEEALHIGVDDYFFSGYICLLEWPVRIRSLIPERHITIEITGDSTINRTYLISKNG